MLIWIIIPVFNRRAITESCLRLLSEYGLTRTMTVCVVDDASTDGTAEMLRIKFPEAVVVQGNGQLFWGGGIEEGMKEALARGAEVVVWLNDDCAPDRGTIECLVEQVRKTKGICGGVCYDSSRKVATYSGYVKQGSAVQRVIPEGPDVLPVDMLSGNLVAIHRTVIEKLGPLVAREYQHYYADAWYTGNAREAGFTVEIHGGAKALNEPSNYFDRIGRTQSVLEAWRILFNFGSPISLPEQWKFQRSVSARWAWTQAAKRILVMVKYSCLAVKRGGWRALIYTPRPSGDGGAPGL